MKTSIQESQQRHHAVATLYGALWKYASGSRRLLCAAWSLLGASQLLRLGMPWVAAQAINHVQQGQLAWAGEWIAALVGLYLGVWVLHGPGRMLERNVGLKIRQRLADDLYAHAAGAPLAWHETHHSGELQHRISQASRALSDFAQTQFVYLQTVVNIIGPLVALSLLSWVCGGVALAGYAVVGCIVLVFDRILMRLAVAENDADRRYTATLVDFLGNISTIIGLRLQRASRHLLGARMDAVLAPLSRSVVFNEGKWCAVDLLGVAITWLLVVIYVWQTRSPGQGLLLGSVFMIYQYAQQAASVVGTMAANFQGLATMYTDFTSADPVLQAPREPGPSHASPRGNDSEGGWRQLTLENVQWHYGKADSRGGLHGVDLVLARGDRVALVGTSGAGKSTLLRVLAGLYRPQEGRLHLDGKIVDWRELKAEATLIPQESEVFEATVRDNLTFGEPASTREIDRALSVSCFDEVLEGLGGNLETQLSERGFNLSGGQRQRLNLARGILAAKERGLMLLDEPTSALDAGTEARVFERLDRAFPETTLIASVHRLALLERFDSVIYMSEGRVVDAGPRSEVLSRQPTLARFVQGASAAEPSAAS